VIKISIITATYNSAGTVADTLASVASQNYPAIEHLIIDGVSKDETLSIVKQFDHVSKVISEPDKGIYDAMNKGIRLATGDVVGILNSDDFYAEEGVLSHVAEAFEKTGCDAVYSDLQYVDQHNVKKVVRHWKAGSYKKNAFLWGWMPPHPTFFVRRSLYEQFGNFSLELRTAADYELMLRFIHKHEINLQYIPGVMVKMRDGGASNASITNRLTANNADRKAWDKNGIRPYWFTLYLKPLRKLGQFLPWTV
jgi:glycosyltransferase